MPQHQISLLIIIQAICFVKSEYKVAITTNSPIIRGATANFTATLYNGAHLASGKFLFIWEDNSIPSHYQEIKSDQPIVSWEVKYNHDYPPGDYEVQVTVKKDYYLIFYEITSARKYFTLTDTLNGQLALIQQNISRNNEFVSTSEPVLHSVNLTDADARFVSNATSVTTFWFIDCIYYGPTNNNQFSHVFPVSGEEHVIDALVVADFHPLPPPTTTTTTTTTTTSTTTKTTPTTTTITTPKTTTITTPKTTTTTAITPVTKPSNYSIIKLSKRETTGLKTQKIMMLDSKGALVRYNGSFPYVCNGSVTQDEKKSYGYFSRKIVAKTPISSVNVTGNNWLQDSELLALNVVCNGAPSLRYCVYFYRGSYNATGNETCEIYISLDTCNFMIQRFFTRSKENTVLIILENDVTKVVKTVAVTIYEATRQAQLSVIVVPVAFSLVAVVIIVFGVAYYIQNRRRFIVEVADFNFGVDYTDMEYKTFRERLQESLVNAFTRAPSPEQAEISSNWSQHGQQKYGSMT